MVSQIYPSEFQLNTANSFDTEAPFLDLNLIISDVLFVCFLFCLFGLFGFCLFVVVFLFLFLFFLLLLFVCSFLLFVFIENL